VTPAQYLSRLNRGEIPPVSLLLGSESYERRRCREALISTHLAGGDHDDERDGAITQYDLSEMELAQVLDDARSLSLFAAKRVIVASAAEAALPRTGKGDDEGDEASGSGGGLKELEAYVASPTPGTALVFESCRFNWEGEDKKKNERVRKFFAAVPEAVELRRYSPDESRVLLEQLGRQAKLSLGAGVAETLSESLGGDAGRIAVELEKLSLFAGSGSVTLEHVAALIPDARETTIFVLVSALGRRDRAQSLSVLDTLCRDGEYLPLALSFLSGQFRMALIAKEANLRSAGQVQSHFTKQGVAMWGSRAEQVTQTATKFTKVQLERGLRLIFAADRDLRSARPDDRIVIERFVVELTAA